MSNFIINQLKLTYTQIKHVLKSCDNPFSNYHPLILKII